MDREFYQLFLDKTHFPPEGKDFLLQAANTLETRGQKDVLDGAVDFYYENQFDTKSTDPLIQEIAENLDLSAYTVWLLFLIQCARPAKDAYLERGIPENIFWGTFEDLKYKALECKAVHGVWGCFVSFWYPIFFSCDIVKLGRLEYESCSYPYNLPYQAGGVTLKKGDPVKSIHIPSSGEPFDKAARLDSYRQAYQFFKEELNGQPLVCFCHSWLLYEENRNILSPSSNIVGFMGDFDLISQEAEEEFGDAWRVFGANHKKPIEDLPETTSMQRAFKRHLLSGKKTGEGLGILVFDGENIVNQ